MKKMSIASFVCAILAALILLVPSGSITFIMGIFVVGIILAIVAVVLGVISMKDGKKKMSIASIVIGSIVFVLLSLSLAGFALMSKAEDCVDNKNGTATCQVMGQEMEIEDMFLTEDQYKK